LRVFKALFFVLKVAKRWQTRIQGIG